MQAVLRKLYQGVSKNLAGCRQACKRLREQCDALIDGITLQLHVHDLKWQLPILARFHNLSELHVDLRHGCKDAHELYSLLADVLRAAPGLQYLHVICGLTDGSAELAMPFTGVLACAMCASGINKGAIVSFVIVYLACCHRIAWELH